MGDYHFWADHFIRATLLTKGIYFLLAFLSVTAWSIMIRKGLQLRKCRRASAAFSELYRKSRRNPLALFRHLSARKDHLSSPLTLVFLKGSEELQSQIDQGGRGGQEGEPALTMRQFDVIGRSLEAAQDRFFLDLEHHLIYLATTVSVAPFLGLLGTVWGILVAFQEMGRQASTGMTAFGPGISEALVSTVAGLIVAIPALLGYNFIGSRIRELAGETSQFATNFLAFIEREYTGDPS